MTAEALACVYHFPLDRGYLCSDVVERDGQRVPCNTVGNNPHACPGCGAAHGLVNLASILNRTIVEDTP